MTTQSYKDYDKAHHLFMELIETYKSWRLNYPHLVEEQADRRGMADVQAVLTLLSSDDIKVLRSYVFSANTHYMPPRFSARITPLPSHDKLGRAIIREFDRRVNTALTRTMDRMQNTVASNSLGDVP